MKITAIFLTLLLGASGAASAEVSLLDRMGLLRDMFDSGIRVESEGAPRLAPSTEDGFSGVPKVNGSAQNDAWIVYRDAFAAQECRVIDAVYIRQPTLEEAEASLQACVRALSEKYRAGVTVARGDGELLIVIGGVIPAGSTVAADLRHAVELRESRLFGHPAKVLRLSDPSAHRKMSSLQFVVDRCPTIKMIQSIRSASDFLSIYGDCLLEAKNLSIRSVLPHPTEADRILVYSADRRTTIDEMSGLLRVVADRGPVVFLVDAQQETLNPAFLPASR